MVEISHIYTFIMRIGNRFLNHMPEHVFSLAKPRLNRPLAKKKPPCALVLTGGK